MTQSGIHPATFRFVPQCLNHCATACPQNERVKLKNYILQNGFSKFLFLMYLAKKVKSTDKNFISTSVARDTAVKVTSPAEKFSRAFIFCQYST
jgi:hypothetical protein